MDQMEVSRFYKENQTEKVIKELIEISEPDINKKTLFIWPEGIIPNTNQDEIYLSTLFSILIYT